MPPASLCFCYLKASGSTETDFKTEKTLSHVCRPITNQLIKNSCQCSGSPVILFGSLSLETTYLSRALSAFTPTEKISEVAWV